LTTDAETSASFALLSIGKRAEEPTKLPANNSSLDHYHPFMLTQLLRFANCPGLGQDTYRAEWSQCTAQGMGCFLSFVVRFAE
jgi:hypothetical protein